MATSRRQIIRPPCASPRPEPQRQRQIQKLRERLERERATLARSMTRLKRAFHGMEKTQAKIARLERTLNRQENA
jgi:hypothetical protein